MFCMDDMVPQNHLLRIIDKAIDWSFIYDFVVGKEKKRELLFVQQSIDNDLHCELK